LDFSKSMESMVDQLEGQIDIMITPGGVVNFNFPKTIDRHYGKGPEDTISDDCLGLSGRTVLYHEVEKVIQERADNGNCY